MISDPNTAEGMKEIQRRLQKRKAEAEEARKRAVSKLDDEPSGKLTDPSEIDLHRDREEE